MSLSVMNETPHRLMRPRRTVCRSLLPAVSRTSDSSSGAHEGCGGACVAADADTRTGTPIRHQYATILRVIRESPGKRLSWVRRTVTLPYLRAAVKDDRPAVNRVPCPGASEVARWPESFPESPGDLDR